MKTKYKSKLVKRAEQNAKQDVGFITDDFLTVNKYPEPGEKTYMVCAVGCLVLPIGKDRKKFIDEVYSKGKVGDYHKRLSEEFNIPETIIEMAEQHFCDLERDCRVKDLSEKQETQRLSNFVIAFAKAIPEGYEWPNEDTVEGSDIYNEIPPSRKGFLEWLRRRDKAATKALAAA